MNGIITLSLVPLRAKDNECSEMTSQLLFGETVEILESKERWLYVRNHSDNYCGWVDKKMISLLPENGEKNHNDIENFRILKPVSFCRNLTKGNTFPLPGGSILRNYQNGNFTDGTYQYAIHPSDAGMPQPLTGNNIVSLARQYLSSPICGVEKVHWVLTVPVWFRLSFRFAASCCHAMLLSRQK